MHHSQEDRGQVRQRQSQLAHALRISTVGALASGLAHEINQPLSTIANDVEACARFLRSGELDANQMLTLLEDASAEAVRAGEIVEHLRHFVQKGEPKCERADLVEIDDGAATAYAKGHAAVQQGDDIVYCDEAYINYDTETLELFWVEGNTSGKRLYEPLYFEADRVYGTFDISSDTQR